MPLYLIRRHGRPYAYRAGRHGTPYPIHHHGLVGAKIRALRQLRAIKARQRTA